MELGKQIRHHRAEMGLSQDQLAQLIFVSRQTISNWENDKNYPDLKSLLLLSSTFKVSLDSLIKGDVDQMKEIIEQESIDRLKQAGNRFTILLLMTILLPVPLFSLLKSVGVLLWMGLGLTTLIYSFKVENLKKHYNVHTFKEITAFYQGKGLEDTPKAVEVGKRPYQKILLGLASGLLTLAAAYILGLIIK